MHTKQDIRCAAYLSYIATHGCRSTVYTPLSCLYTAHDKHKNLLFSIQSDAAMADDWYHKKTTPSECRIVKTSGLVS